jgi:septal ring factor EnvC (AmiA/AmiB activator)
MSDHDLREAQYRLKQAHKTIGKQGRTIHTLRSELAEVRELHHKIERGVMRQLERQVDALTADLEAARNEIKALREQAKESHT